MVSIEINNKTTARINKIFISRVLRKSLKLLKKQINVSVAIVGPNEIRRLNRIYRQIDRATDVLSFEDLNEIIICYQQARKQAKKFGHSVEDEIKLLLIHGLLHLLGYDHQTKTQKRRLDKLSGRLFKN